MNENLTTKITAAVQLGAIGDALGLQTEAQRSWQIFERFPRGVNALLPLNSINIHPDYSNTSHVGVTSDDTLFMLAMMEGLHAGKGWSKEVQLQKLIQYYDLDPIGFGKNTREAIKIIRAGGSLPLDIPSAVGSGPVTRLFPLSVWLRCRDAVVGSRTAIVHEMTKQTHPNETTCTFSSIHDQVINILLSGPNNVGDILGASYGKNTIPHLNALFRNGRVPSDLEIRLAYGLDEGKINGINRAFAVWNILGASYAFFLRNPSSFQSVIDAASNGGDTDSMAHIVGTMVGIHTPEVAQSPEVVQLFDQLQIKSEIIQSTEQFKEIL